MFQCFNLYFNKDDFSEVIYISNIVDIYIKTLLVSIVEIEKTIKKNNDGSLKSIIFFGAAPNGFEYTTKPSFYSGKKLVHYINHFSKNNNYLITWGGDEGLQALKQEMPSGTIENNMNTHTRRVFFEEELTNAFHSGSGKQFFGRTYFSEPFTQDLINVASEGTMTYNFVLGQARADKFQGTFTIKDNGKLISDNLVISSTKEEAVRKLYEISIPISELPKKNKSTIQIQFNNPGHPGANGIFDYYELHYGRLFDASK